MLDMREWQRSFVDRCHSVKIRNYPKNWAFGKFPKTPGISEISGWFIFQTWETSQKASYLENFPKSQIFKKKIHHPEIPIGIWEIWRIPQIPGNLGKSQMPRNLRNFFKSIIGVGSCICLRWRVGWGVKGVYLVSKRGGGDMKPHPFSILYIHYTDWNSIIYILED